MANNLAALNPQLWANESIENLYANMVMANLVHRDFENIPAAKGDTINTRRPNKFVANDMGATISIQDASATNVQVVLNKWKEVSFVLGDKDLTLDIGDLFTMYAQPAMEALAQQIDKDLLSLYVDIPTSVGSAGVTADKALVISARQKLNEQNVPFQDRSVVWSAKDEAALVGLPEFSAANQVGDDGTALREASLGRKFGMNHYLDQNVIATGAAPVTTHNLAFHRNAFCLTTRPLATPIAGSGANAAIVNYKGIGLRTAIAWDINKKQHVVSIDCLYGVKTLYADLAVQLLA